MKSNSQYEGAVYIKHEPWQPFVLKDVHSCLLAGKPPWESFKNIRPKSWWEIYQLQQHERGC